MKKIIFLFIFIVVFMSGCKASEEINQLGVVSALGIEKQDDEFIVTAQLINIKKTTEGGTSDKSNVITYTESGKTIFEVLRKITTKSSKKLYMAHMKLVIVDKSIINGNPADIIDFFGRDSESMLNFYILVSTEDKPKEILNTLTPFEDVPAEYITKVLKASDSYYGASYLMTFEQYLDNLITEEIDPAYTKIALTEEARNKDSMDSLKTSELSSYIKLGNVLVFDKNKLLVELTENDSKAYNIVKNDAKNTSMTFPCKDKNYYSVELLGEKVSLKFDEKKEKVTFNVKITASISDYNCKESLLKKENTNEIKKQMKKSIEKDIKSVLNKSLSYQSDFLGVGIFIKARYNDYFDFKNKDWATEGFTKLKLDSNVKIELEKRGNLKNMIKYKDQYD